MRTYVVASILIIVGLAAIAFKGSLAPTDWRVPYLTELSSALLVGGLLSILFKVFQAREAEANLRRLMRIHDSVDELGLTELLPESQGYNYSDIILNSGELSIVINDGLRWTGNNAVSLKERFSKAGTVTEVFTVDPESTFVASLALKTSTRPEDLKRKITDTWARLLEAWDLSSRRGTLTIYALRHYPTRSLYLTEDVLVETPYQVAGGRAKIPVYVFRRVPRQDSPYAFGKHDVESLRVESTVARRRPEATATPS